MDVRKVWLLAVLIAIAGHVHAQEPTPAKPAAPSPTETSAAPTETKSEPAEKSAALEGKLDQDKIMAAQKAGYEIRNENGQTLLCRKDPKTGSRLRHTVSCMTAKEWEQLQSDTQQTLRTIERRRVGPNGN
jgi:hypothetical protein